MILLLSYNLNNIIQLGSFFLATFKTLACICQTDVPLKKNKN